MAEKCDISDISDISEIRDINDIRCISHISYPGTCLQGDQFILYKTYYRYLGIHTRSLRGAVIGDKGF